MTPNIFLDNFIFGCAIIGASTHPDQIYAQLMMRDGSEIRIRNNYGYDISYNEILQENILHEWSYKIIQ